MKQYGAEKCRKKEWMVIGLSFTRKMRYDYVSSFAAHAALFMLISLFPMLMYAVSMLHYLPIYNDNILVQYLEEFIPTSLIPFLNQIIQEAYAGGSTTLKSVTIIMTLVCASKGVYAIIIGLNAVYGIRETRNVVLLYIISVCYVVAFFCILGLLVIMIIFGNRIFNTIMRFLPVIASIQTTFHLGKYLWMLAILLIFFLALYMNVPNRKSKIRYEIPGAMFSTVVCLCFSWVFSFYIDNFANYSIIYGSLATLVIFILWLYGMMFILMIGAELNVVLRKFAEYGFNYRRAYEYYKDEYQVDLDRQKDSMIRFRKRRR